MQGEFVGDIGDLAKLGLLRALSADKKQLGVAWYLYPDQGRNDGQHFEYVDQPQYWRAIDPGLFGGLQGIITRWRNNQGPRAVMDPAYLSLLPGAVFADEMLRADGQPNRAEWRRGWFKRVANQLRDCDLVFVDPDNGLCANYRFNYNGGNHGWKRLPLGEALALSDNCTAVIYHHNSRFVGGSRAEIDHWMQQLPDCTHAFRCRRYGNRTFFVRHADAVDVGNLVAFVERWIEAEKSAGIGRELLSELIVRG